MSKTPLSLQEVVRRAQERHPDSSGRALATLARSHGHSITFTTINHMLRGTYRSRPSDETIRALAFLADLPVNRVYEAAGVQAPASPLADELPPGADRLTPQQRRAVVGVVAAFVAQNEKAQFWDDLTRKGDPGWRHVMLMKAAHGGSARAQELLDDMKESREEAERARAADPPSDLAARTGEVEDVDPALRDD